MAYPDPKNIEDLQRAWPTSHVGELDFISANYAGILEADVAYDGERLYLGAFNMPVKVCVPEYPNDFGNTLNMCESAKHPTNSTIYGLDANTGEEIWSFFIDGAGFRGGLTVSGGLVYVPSGDGFLYLLKADTGEVIAKRSFGVGLYTQATIGADGNGDMKVFVQTGGMSIASWGPAVYGAAGAMIALGLSDGPGIISDVVQEGPEPEIIVEPEIVEVEKIVELETKEIVTETQTLISPISYLMIIISFIILAISATLFVTSGSWKFGS